MATTTPTVYVICDNNCKFEGMTKEQILTAIMQAVESGEIKDVDAGFITTVKTINGLPLKFFVGEQAAYDALPDADKINLFAVITNDTTKEGLLAAINAVEEWAAGVKEGKIAVPIAGKIKTEVIPLTDYYVSISKAGLYSVLISYSGIDNCISVMMPIYDLSKTFYVDQYVIHGSDRNIITVNYSSTDKRITKSISKVDNSGDFLDASIIECRLITEF